MAALRCSVTSLVSLLGLCFAACGLTRTVSAEEWGGVGAAAAQVLASGNHTNNWAVLVDASRFWFNYRHVANVLSIYRSVRRLGIPDSHILLMLSDDMACNARNVRPATVFKNADQTVNVYGGQVEVDYRGDEVTVEALVRLLTGRQEVSTPASKRLLSDDGSNVLVYMTGHGGDGFLKFQDAEEITSTELADAFGQMWQQRRYANLFFMIDTCQAASMYEKLYSPNILAVASSQVGEDSLSHHLDPTLGVYVMDKYTYHALEFLDRLQPDSRRTMAEFLRVCPPHQCVSTVGVRSDLFGRDPATVLVTEFFGSVRKVQLTDVQESLPDLSAGNVTQTVSTGTASASDSVKAESGGAGAGVGRRYVHVSQFPVI